MNSRDGRAAKLLRGIYPKQFISNIHIFYYNKKDQEMKVRMRAPEIWYMRLQPDELTGIQYLMAVSQLVYVFIHFLISDSAIELISEKDLNQLINSGLLPWHVRLRLRLKRSYARKQEYLFELLMYKYKLKFQHLDIKFKKILNRGDSFEVWVKLKNARKTHSGLPLVFIELGGEVLEGQIVNVALLSNLDITTPSSPKEKAQS